MEQRFAFNGQQSETFKHATKGRNLGGLRLAFVVVYPTPCHRTAYRQNVVAARKSLKHGLTRVTDNACLLDLVTCFRLWTGRPPLASLLRTYERLDPRGRRVMNTGSCGRSSRCVWPGVCRPRPGSPRWVLAVSLGQRQLQVRKPR